MRSAFVLITALLPLLTYSQITKIYAIQGSAAASPLLSQTVTTEGVVYATFQAPGLLSGFFIQDTLGDANPATSDGIFVYNPGGTAVSTGDYVTVTGQVQEYFDLTEIGNVTDVTITGTVGTMIAPTPVNLPVANMAVFEALEGMYVSFPQTLTVTDNYNLGKYGELTLATARQTIPTNVIDPNDNPASGNTTSGNSNVPAITAQIDLNNRSRILIDDARTTSWPNPVPYIEGSTQTLRNGSTAQNITGALSYGFSKYRLMPTAAPAFNYAARPTVPNTGGDITVASYNILNFFTTIDDGVNGARGADSPAEYIRQRDKLISALDSIRADIFALVEVENNGTTAADSIVAALNAAIGSDDYALVTESPFTGTYAIKNVFIYNTNTVTPIDTTMTAIDPIFYPPPIAHQFEVHATGARFNLIANHYRYKGCEGATGADLDQGDGQSCYNATRRQQSTLLLDFFEDVATMTANDDLLIVGDFNSYEQEDPIDIFAGAGYTKLMNNAYSYAYMSEFGSLDHAFASPGLSAAVNDAAVWHINSDEPTALDYNLESIADDLYAVTPYRSSDHDPVLIGLSPTHVVGIGEQTLPFPARVFPNPFHDALQLFSDATVDLQLTDLSGRTIATVNVVTGTHTLDTSALPAGVILVHFYQNGERIGTRRVIRR